MSDTCITQIENYWKIKTKNATNLFNQGNYHEALTNYNDALYRAEVLTKNTKFCKGVGIPFIQVYIISCNNLANTYKKLNEPEKAIKMIKKTVYYLLYLTKNNQSNMQEIQSELRKATINYFNLTKTIKYTDNEEYLMFVLKENYKNPTPTRNTRHKNTKNA
ncbi:tetratricopeptide repeat protein [Tenacibaculum sp. Bg11-29]|uniref:tetratricopeptide repeat protein n=1 Tax=Tenacibaculum sp. Bg11-29 TaxID=2058306 RepID=UPI000C326A52|nr:tetratricopeptide repeat protein [Tenacibaculum sp. Bg11-29]PKH49473.1 tetratricopeptide repeat protein [Tenacibaculum sp. Bg11-29]